MPRFENVSCSQCGKDFGPGDHGFSHCCHHRNACERCKHWTRSEPNDLTAPEGICGLAADPGHWPFGFWPNTLSFDGCGDGFKERTPK